MADPPGRPPEPRPAVPPRGKAKPPGQTQGKVERLHGSSVRELVEFDARRGSEADFAADCARWRGAYNHLRPHEALGDEVPASRWRPSPRRRPDALPDAESYYPAGSVLRAVGDGGTISYRGLGVLCGKGIVGQRVRVEDRGRGGLAVFYAWKQFRDLSPDALARGRTV